MPPDLRVRLHECGYRGALDHSRALTPLYMHGSGAPKGPSVWSLMPLTLKASENKDNDKELRIGRMEG